MYSDWGDDKLRLDTLHRNPTVAMRLHNHAIKCNLCGINTMFQFDPLGDHYLIEVPDECETVTQRC